MLIYPKLKSCIKQLANHELDTGIRHGAERQLGKLLMQLVDGKIRHGLSHSQELQELSSAVLDPALELGGSAGILLDHFRYRLAHVAMRSRDWDLALQLLSAVAEGRSSLRLARIYHALCISKLSDRCLDPGELQRLVIDLVSAEPPDALGPLDLAVQDPVTNMAELFLLLQGASEEVIDGLYDPKQGDPFARGLTSCLEVLFVPADGKPATLETSEWLALRQLKELQAAGWLVVDAVATLGELGRGTPAKVPKGEPNKQQLCALLQILAKEAPQSLDLQTLRSQFFADAGPDLIGKPGSDNDRGKESENPVNVERATKGTLVSHQRLVIDHADRRWTLLPPYAVIKRDARRELAHVQSRPQ